MRRRKRGPSTSVPVQGTSEVSGVITAIQVHPVTGPLDSTGSKSASVNVAQISSASLVHNPLFTPSLLESAEPNRKKLKDNLSFDEL